MISVCIPVYNFDVGYLLKVLSKQAKEINGEIIVIDDFSRVFEEKNRKVAESLDNVRYYRLNENIGRAKIRNLFLKYAKFDYLLFLDCDSIVSSPHFLKKYAEFIEKEQPEVVCGGRVYGERPKSRKRMLRWLYGTSRETKPAHIRELTPNASFMTNNFLIRRDILEKVKFNEDLTKYGHEDTLFGFDLKRRGIKIYHIGNPVANGELEKNDDFVRKTEQAIENLIYIVKYIELSHSFAEDIPLIMDFKIIKEKGNLWLYKLLFFIFRFPLKLFLKTGYASMKLFDFYRLGYFIWKYDKI
jgi:glycosyltransferase involved in cell wall biosynthesis